MDTAVSLCKECNKPISLSFDEETKAELTKYNICFSCNFWREKAELKDRCVIDGVMYWADPKITEKPTDSRFYGMGGRRFDIEWFDGRKQTTYSLWCNGQIPSHYRERIPDNARFLNGAEAAMDSEGKLYAFNPSRS